jgi:hypothetical protein
MTSRTPARQPAASPDAPTDSLAAVGGSAGDTQGVSAALVALLAFWGVILAYSVLVSAVLAPRVLTLVGGVLGEFAPDSTLRTPVRWWEMFAHYAVAMAAFYAWHWQCHRRLRWVPFNARCVQLHAEHHWRIYPPTAFFGQPSADGALQVTHDSFVTQHEALLYVLLAAAIAFAFVALRENPVAIAFALVLDIVIGLGGNALHQSFHVRGHWLERFSAFHELRAVHHIHHLGSARMNYAVFNVGLDWLMGSLLLADPTHPADPAAPCSRVGGLASAALGLQAVPRAEGSSLAIRRGPAAVLFRLVVVGALAAAWFRTQDLLAATLPPAPRADRYDWLFAYVPATARPHAWLCVYAATLDLQVLTLLALGVVGTTVRPLVAVTVAFALRQALCLLGTHANPAESLWQAPRGYGGLFVTFELVEHALSGGVLIAVVFLKELAPLLGWFLKARVDPALRSAAAYAIGGAVLAFQVYALAALRAEWATDVAVSCVVGLYAFRVATGLAPALEAMLP